MPRSTKPIFHTWIIIMHLLLYLLLAIFLLSSAFLLRSIRKNDQNFRALHPPGPPRFPIIGNLHQFMSNSSPHLYLFHLSKLHGPFMSIKLGFLNALVISSAEVAKEALRTNDEAFSGRPPLTTHRRFSYGGSDVAFAPYGESWRQLRRVCIAHVFSLKRVKSFAPVVEGEVSRMVGKIMEGSGEVDLSEATMGLTGSVICRVGFGRMYGGSNGVLREAQELFGSLCFEDCFGGFMRWVDGVMGIRARLEKTFMELDEIYEEVIEEHLKRDGDDDVDDVVDALIKLERNGAPGVKITRDHIKGVLMDILLAGTDTSAATLVWAMTELVQHPKAMNQLQKEVRALKETKPHSRMIKEQDLEELTYLKAVVKETHRLHPASPLLVPRQTTKKCSIQGYEIQQDTMVFVNAYAIGRDPLSWERPEEFEPERFMCANPIDVKGQDFELIPFGSGRRSCPGIKLSGAMVELALANLVCLFDWRMPVGREENVMDTSVMPGITPHKKVPLRLLANRATF